MYFFPKEKKKHDSLPHQTQSLVIKSYQGNNRTSMLLILFMIQCPGKAEHYELPLSLVCTAVIFLLHVCPLLFRYHVYSHIDISRITFGSSRAFLEKELNKRFIPEQCSKLNARVGKKKQQDLILLPSPRLRNQV